MKNEYNVTLYPFDVESVPLIRHSNLVNNINFAHVVSPNGWGFTGKDAGSADSGEDIGISVESDFDKALESSDTVFFNKPAIKIDLNELIYPKIIKAAENFKNIICTIEIESEILNKIIDLCNKNNTFFKYFSNEYNNIKVPEFEKIYKIYTPVIFVAGTNERTNKFEIQLNLRENIEKMGYSVSQIGSRNYCELLGFHSFPKFMYSKELTESEKVILFNYYVKNIEANEKPDVIIIGVPGATMPFDYDFTNKFGILAYEISQAVKPDSVILSTLFGEYDLDFYKLVSNSHKYKLGYDIDCYNLANTAVNLADSKFERELQYNTMDSEFINIKKKSYKAKFNIPICNILDKEDAQNMTQLVIDKLADYGEVQNV